MNPHVRTGRRRLVSLAGAVAVLAWVLPAPATAVEFTTTAPQGYLIDAETGTVLLAKEADQPMPPASMSKLMTVYMTFEALQDGRLSLDTELPVSREAWQKGGSKMFVEVDTMVPVIDLLRGVIVQSGNDSSIVLAEGIGGTESGFASLMNHRARELGLQDSHFTNSTGWPDPNHVMSPRDLALLTILIVDHFPEYFPLFSETEYTYGGIKQQNRNPLLYRNMGAEGMKTGYTKAAGYGLTASALRNGRRLVLVLNGMNSPRQRVSEATRLLELAFAQTEAVHLADAGEVIGAVSVAGGRDLEVPVASATRLAATLPRGSGRDDTEFFIRYEGPVTAPIAAGAQVASLVVSNPMQAPTEYPLVAATPVPEVGLFMRMVRAAGFLIWGPP
ncbi:MAG: D-alanyl-D-alanine carboxypeptidase [Rhodospirillales bacterium]|nr:D-alanyl-D-alanine carboxypeptidase [Rhodospirillales bacterium]MDE0373283.1 D-alanyl-D-alanine carboxypeptidase [Rhodospirillales bacterium]